MAEENPEEGISQPKKWISMHPMILKELAPGMYPLRSRVQITPGVDGIQHCSKDDQRLIADMDMVERDLLHTGLMNKIRELSEKRKKPMVLLTNATSQFPDVSVPQLHIIENNYVGKKIIAMRTKIGELLTMAYDQIYIPIDPAVAKIEEPKYETEPDPDEWRQDHNYWNDQE